MKRGIMKNYIAIGALIVVVLLFVVYGVFWVSKKVSYEVFYEGQVKDTIKEMVKPEALYDKNHQ